jgi:DNA-binding LacI/PurR family transcriptional regulator
MSKRVALPSAHDVARLAGVSQAAVSRTFTPGASISEKTRSKVLEAAIDLGYRPNHLAKSLITGKSGIIGVVIGNPRNTFHLDALDILSDFLSKAGLHLQVFTSRAEENSDELVEALLRFRVDALLLMSMNLSDKMATHCQRIGVPVIFFNRRPTFDKGFFSVTAANFLGGGRVADYFLEQGYARPAIITASDHSLTSHEREDGFIAKLVSKGLPHPLKAKGGHGLAAVPAARRLLSLDNPPDAIFCTSDYMAMATIEVARFDFGLEVGRQLGVAGFDDTWGASWRSFDLTSYTQPVEPMIEQVMQIILDPMAYVDTPNFMIEGELIARNSTRRIHPVLTPALAEPIGGTVA